MQSRCKFISFYFMRKIFFGEILIKKQSQISMTHFEILLCLEIRKVGFLDTFLCQKTEKGTFFGKKFLFVSKQILNCFTPVAALLLNRP